MKKYIWEFAFSGCCFLFFYWQENKTMTLLAAIMTLIVVPVRWCVSSNRNSN